MSYEVLARKWRPQTFDDVVGQEHVTTALRNAIRADRVPHAVLLTGPRGVGKTTLARILARCLNCEKGPTDTPCGECPSCTEIISGHSTDVQEIDAASRTSVDDVREIIEAVRYAPSPGKHRIYVVDEVHMLSTAAFNALLKTLEEPPPRSLFVFATTNPEKIPFTVLSRCQRHDLRRIPASEIVERLGMICRDEKVKISDSSLRAVAREADGSLRDGQTLLDQLIAFGGSDISDEQVVQVLDLVDRRLLLEILTACVDGDAAAALERCGRAGDSGTDPKRLGENLLQVLRDLVVLRVAPESNGLVDASDAELAELRAVAERAEEGRLRRMFRALVKEQEDLAWAPQPLAVLEMALVRLAQMPAGDDVGRLLSRLDALERRLAGEAPGGGSSGGGGGSKQSGPGPSGKPRSRSASRSEPAPNADSASDLRAATIDDSRGDLHAATNADSRGDLHAATLDEPAAPPAAADSSAGPGGAEPPSDPDDSYEPPGEPLGAEVPRVAPDASAPLAVVFDRLRAFTSKRAPRLAAALEGGRLLERSAGSLRLAAPSRFAAKRLAGRREALQDLWAEFFGHPVTVEVELPDSGSGRDAARSSASREARQKALNHPAVSLAREVLEGEIAEIRPLGPAGGPQ